MNKLRVDSWALKRKDKKMFDMSLNIKDNIEENLN